MAIIIFVLTKFEISLKSLIKALIILVLEKFLRQFTFIILIAVKNDMEITILQKIKNMK